MHTGSRSMHITRCVFADASVCVCETPIQVSIELHQDCCCWLWHKWHGGYEWTLAVHSGSSSGRLNINTVSEF